METALAQTLEEKLAVFVLVWARMSGLFLLAPFFGGQAIPRRLKILFAAAVAACVVPTISDRGPATVAALSDPLMASLTVGSELLLGVAVGFLAGAIFAAIQAGGHLISLDMGMAVASVMDPVSNLRVSILGQLKSSLAVLLFLLLDFHHEFLRMLTGSFRLMAPGSLVERAAAPGVGAQLAAVASEQGAYLLIRAAQMALPVTVSLILVTVAMAFLSRAVPEMNVFILGFGVRILVGFWVLLLIFPALALFYETLFHGAVVEGLEFLRALAGSTTGG